MRLRVISVLALVVLAACTKQDRQVAFDDIYFKAKTSRLGDDLADFTTTVEGVSVAVHAALEAGRYEGTKYCIANYGTSSIAWTVGPDTDPEDLDIVGDALTLQGRCDP
jgi:hypothetical protein